MPTDPGQHVPRGLGHRDTQSCQPQHSSIWKEDCCPGSQCIPKPSSSDLPHHRSGRLPKAKVLPFNQVPLEKSRDMISAEVCVCGAAPQQHHVPAASTSTGVLIRDIGSPGAWLPQGRLAVQREPQLQIGILGCADGSLLY